MEKIMKSKAKGLNESLIKFSRKIADCNSTGSGTLEFTKLISEEMENLDFDKVTSDKAGNLIGVIKGYENKDALVVISHLDILPAGEDKTEALLKSGVVKFKAGIVSSVYSGALIKRTLLPLTGDLIVCCVPRLSCCDFGIKYLFENQLKSKLKKIRGVVLCEPTDFNINLGHKGRMEYEIIIKGRLNRNFLENRGMNMLGTMFPLISELEKASKQLPNDSNLGYSNLRIKDVRYSGYQPKEEFNEFRVVVDRAFIPEENFSGILSKAKTIAKNVYKGEPDVTINTVLAMEKVKTHTGMELVSEKKIKPWVMESHQGFALDSLKSLTDGGFKSSFGYWKKIITEGSYTCAELNIPTIGFGAGSEDMMDSGAESLSMDKLERAVYGQALIIQRNIGVPAFGWSSDEI
jgi:acetylornithine deacetylase/succinyl-diaminopimelate desuccinylase-like protein